MKVVAYSIKSFEKEYLAKANQKKHDITLISNSLSLETASYAEGKDAVVVITDDDLSSPVISRLAEFGIKYIATRSASTDQIDKVAAAANKIKVANVPDYSSQAIAEHALALALSLSRQIIKTDIQNHPVDLNANAPICFNFYGKTVGLIGLGDIGQAVANIFNGMGCRVIGYDVIIPEDIKAIECVPLNRLLKESDIISLHAPANRSARHIINSSNIEIMKKGVMLINTSGGALINMVDLLEGVDSGKIAYLGLDAGDYHETLFFETDVQDTLKHKLLSRLWEYPNVLVSPHQNFLTQDALQQIANQTIKNLDNWQQNKCVGKACVCDKNCRVNEIINQSNIN